VDRWLRKEERAGQTPRGYPRGRTAGYVRKPENNIRKVIIDAPVNPKYYEKMSELLTP